MSSTIPTFDRDITEVKIRHNRGHDNKFDEKASQRVAVNLYTIDSAILYFLQNGIRPTVTQDNKQIQVPVIYGNPERWKSTQSDGSIRDKNGKVMLPIIMIRRSGIKRNSMNSPVNKHLSYTFQTKWNSRNIYDRFAVVNRVTPSEIYHETTFPDYYDVTYEAIIWTEFMEQMNGLVENISVESNEYWGPKTGYRFLTRIDQIDQVTDLPVNTDRMVRSKFELTVKAYLLPQSMLNNDDLRASTSKTRYGIKKVVFTKEIVTS